MAQVVYVAYDAQAFSTTPISTSLVGARIGWEGRWSGSRLAGFVEAGYLQARSDDFELMLLSVGGKYAALARGRFDVGVQGFVDVEHADLSRFRNVNVLLGFGAGAYAEVRVVPRASLIVNLSARGLLDVTPPTRCNDGSSSQSTGQGTCSWHGGIDFYTDQLGEGTGLDALVGVRVWFGMKDNVR